MVATDFDRDGREDLVMTRRVGWGGDVAVLRSDGAGGFAVGATATGGIAPFALAVADLDGDGIDDVAAADGDRNGSGLHALLGDGAGGFGASRVSATGEFPSGLVLADFDADDDADVAISSRSGSYVHVMLGDGTGAFLRTAELRAGFDPGALTVGDYDNDLRQDLAFVNGGGGVRVYLGDGRGAFRGPAELPIARPHSIASGDLDGNLTQDLVVAATAQSGQPGETVTVFLGDGRGGFAAGAPVYVHGLGIPKTPAVADLDGDGDQDVAVPVANAGRGFLTVLLGDGRGGFDGRREIDYPASVVPGDATVSDLDGDRRCDLIVAMTYTYGPGVAVYRGARNGAVAAADDDACRDRVREPVGPYDLAPSKRSLTVRPGARLAVRYAVSDAASVRATLQRRVKRRTKVVARARGLVAAGRHVLRLRAPRTAAVYSLAIVSGSLEGALDTARVRVVVRKPPAQRAGTGARVTPRAG